MFSQRRRGVGNKPLPVLESALVSKSPSDSTTLSVSLVSGVSVGDTILIFAVGETKVGATNSFTTIPSGYSEVGKVGSQTTSCCMAVYAKEVVGGEGAATVTLANSAGILAWSIRVSGGNLAALIHQSSFSEDDSASHPIGGVTTTRKNCLILYMLGFRGGDGRPFSVSGTGFSEYAQDDNGTGAGDPSGCFGQRDLETAGASGTATVTSAVSDNGVYCQIAISP